MPEGKSENEATDVGPGKSSKELPREERRSCRRYAVTLDLRWSLIHRGRAEQHGLGRTLDLSSTGLKFDAGRELAVGNRVVVTILWPTLLASHGSSEFHIRGEIVRAAGCEAAMRIARHDFVLRTQSGSVRRNDSESRSPDEDIESNSG